MHPNVHVRSEAGGLLNLQGGRIAMLPHLSCTVSTIKVLSGTTQGPHPLSGRLCFAPARGCEGEHRAETEA